MELITSISICIIIVLCVVLAYQAYLKPSSKEVEILIKARLDEFTAILSLYKHKIDIELKDELTPKLLKTQLQVERIKNKMLSDEVDSYVKLTELLREERSKTNKAELENFKYFIKGFAEELKKMDKEESRKTFKYLTIYKNTNYELRYDFEKDIIVSIDEKGNVQKANADLYIRDGNVENCHIK